MTQLRSSVRTTALLVVAVLLALPTAAVADQATTTVVLSRHAEKVPDGSRDPELTDEGRARAERLAFTVAELGVTTVYSTPFERTKDTAAPTAAAAGVETTIVDVAGDHIGDMVRRLRSDHQGETLLVVGHSNTVPEIVAGLGCDDVPPIADDEYDELWIVSFGGDDRPICLHLQY